MESKGRKLDLAIFAKLILVYLLRLVNLYIIILKLYVKDKTLVSSNVLRAISLNATISFL